MKGTQCDQLPLLREIESGIQLQQFHTDLSTLIVKAIGRANGYNI
jgi:hypothetical protein